jgi:hypothetical protein
VGFLYIPCDKIFHRNFSWTKSPLVYDEIGVINKEAHCRQGVNDKEGPKRQGREVVLLNLFPTNIHFRKEKNGMTTKWSTDDPIILHKSNKRLSHLRLWCPASGTTKASVHLKFGQQRRPMSLFAAFGYFILVGYTQHIIQWSLVAIGDAASLNVVDRHQQSGALWSHWQTPVITPHFGPIGSHRI